MVSAGRFHHDPGLGIGVLEQPLLEHFETGHLVWQFGLGAVLAIGLLGGDVERAFGDIDADDAGHKNSSCWFRKINTSLSSTLLMRALAGGGLWIPFEL